MKILVILFVITNHYFCVIGVSGSENDASDSNNTKSSAHNNKVGPVVHQTSQHGPQGGKYKTGDPRPNNLPPGVIDVCYGVQNDEFVVTHGRDNGLPSHTFSTRVESVITRVVDGDNVLWEAYGKRTCKYVRVSYKGCKCVLYLLSAKPGKVRSGMTKKYSYYVKNGGDWRIVNKSEYKKKKKLLIRGIKTGVIDVSRDPNSNNVEVSSCIVGNTSFLRYTASFNCFLVQVNDGNDLIWKGSVGSQECHIVDICKRNGEPKLISLTIYGSDGHKLLKYYDKVGGIWAEISKEPYDLKIKSIRLEELPELAIVRSIKPKVDTDKSSTSKDGESSLTSPPDGQKSKDLQSILCDNSCTVDFSVLETTGMIIVTDSFDEKHSITTRVYRPKKGCRITSVTDGAGQFWEVDEHFTCKAVTINTRGIHSILSFSYKKVGRSSPPPKTIYYEKLNSPWTEFDVSEYNAKVKSMYESTILYDLDVNTQKSDEFDVKLSGNKTTSVLTYTFTPKPKTTFNSINDSTLNIFSVSTGDECLSAVLLKKGNVSLLTVTVKLSTSKSPTDLYFEKKGGKWININDSSSYNAKVKSMGESTLSVILDIDKYSSDEFDVKLSEDKATSVLTYTFTPKPKTTFNPINASSLNILSLSTGDECLSAVLLKKGNVSLLTVTVKLSTSKSATDLYFEKKAGKWIGINDSSEYNAKVKSMRESKVPSHLDISCNQVHDFVVTRNEDKKKGILIVTYKSTALTYITKVKDGNNILWSADKGDSCASVVVSYRSGYKRTFVKVVGKKNDSEDVKYFEKIDKVWFGITKGSYNCKLNSIRDGKALINLNIETKSRTGDFNLIANYDKKTDMTNYKYQPNDKGSKIVKVYDGAALIFECDISTEEIIRVLLTTKRGEDMLLHVLYKTEMNTKPLCKYYIRFKSKWIIINVDEYNSDLDKLKNHKPISPPDTCEGDAITTGTVDTSRAKNVGRFSISDKKGAEYSAHVYAPLKGFKITSIVDNEDSISLLGKSSNRDTALVHHKAGTVLLVDVFKSGDENSHLYFGKFKGKWYILSHHQYVNRIEELKYSPVIMNINMIHETDKYNTSIDKQDNGVLSVYFNPYEENRIAIVKDDDRLIWENGKDDERCIYAVFHGWENRAVMIIFLMGINNGFYYKKDGNDWRRITKEAYKDEYYVLSMGRPVILDISNVNPVDDISVDIVEGKGNKITRKYGADGKANIAKIVDGEELVWEKTKEVDRCTLCIYQLVGLRPVSLKIEIKGRRERFTFHYKKGVKWKRVVE